MRDPLSSSGISVRTKYSGTRMMSQQGKDRNTDCSYPTPSNLNIIAFWICRRFSA